jgi:hypothetical protein
MATGNAGLPTPGEQGLHNGIKGWNYENPYTERGEELEHEAYRKGYHAGYQHFLKRQEVKLLNKNA